ncbi:hypothetical protein B0H14DRAFT_3707120 [Mycena olivaceomarginata]|nr:hypothetical protein B0H14DRAFT_3707120 [Mycena olivaceomarginata]
MECLHGNYSKGLHLAKEAYRIGRALGNVRGELTGIQVQAQCHLALGNFKQSLELLDEGKQLIVRVGIQGGQMETGLMSIEAIVYHDKTEYSDARRIQEAILHRTSAVLSPVGNAYALLNIAILDIVTGASTDVVSRKLNGAMTTFRNVHDPRGISFCDCVRADLQLREGDVTEANVQYIRSFLFAARDRDNDLAKYCLEKLANPLEPVHANTEAERWAVVFLAFALRPRVRSPLTVHQAMRCLGDVLVRQGADKSALNILDLALEGFTRMGVHQSRAECMRTIGDVHVQRGNLSKAREMWEAARPLFECSEQKKEVARIDKRLETLGIAQKFEALPKTKLPAPQIPLQESDMEGEEQKPHSIADL